MFLSSVSWSTDTASSAERCKRCACSSLSTTDIDELVSIGKLNGSVVAPPGVAPAAAPMSPAVLDFGSVCAVRLLVDVDCGD